MAAKTTNESIFYAIQAMGYAPSMGPIDPAQLKGNQHSEFKERMKQLYHIGDEDFDAAERIALKFDAAHKSGGTFSEDMVRGFVQSEAPNAPSLKAQISVDPATGKITTGPPAPLSVPPPPSYAVGGGPVPKPTSATPQPSQIISAPPATQTTATAPSKATKKPTTTPTTTGTPGAPGGPGAQDKGLPANASPDQVTDYFRKNYGAEAWMLNIPDFAGLVKDIATSPGGWTDSSVMSAVMQKDWWKQNGQTVADYLEKKERDPVGFKEGLKAWGTQIRNKAATYGIAISDERINQMADNAYKWGWKDDDLNQAVAAEFHYQNNQPTVLGDKLKTDAKNYLVPVSDDVMQQWGQRLIANPNEQGNWQEFLKSQAKSMFPSFGARLDAGETMQQIADPYAQLAGKWLEMDPKNVDFTDPKWMTALDQVDQKGNHSNMSLSDWTQKIKSDPQYRYDYTDNAKQAATGFATDILKKFGRIA